jgi:PAS domain S-box-containing protein
MALIHPDDRDRAIEMVARSVQTHQPYDFDYRAFSPDGLIRWMHGHGEFLKDETGQEIKLKGTIQDITDRKLAEETIKTEQQRTQTILESITIPMIISRISDSKVVYANPAFAQFRGLAVEKLIGNQTSDFFVNPDDRNKLEATLRHQGYANDFETQLQRPDGIMIWVLLSSRIFDYQNEFCVLTTLVDITNRKRMEEVLQLSEERFQLVTYATNDAVWDVNLRTGKQWWSGIEVCNCSSATQPTRLGLTSPGGKLRSTPKITRR